MNGLLQSRLSHPIILSLQSYQGKLQITLRSKEHKYLLEQSKTSWFKNQVSHSISYHDQLYAPKKPIRQGSGPLLWLYMSLPHFWTQLIVPRAGQNCPWQTAQTAPPWNRPIPPFKAFYCRGPLYNLWQWVSQVSYALNKIVLCTKYIRHTYQNKRTSHPVVSFAY